MTQSGWEMEKNILLLSKQFQQYFPSKTLGFKILKNSSEMKTNALMHREGLKGLIYWETFDQTFTTM